MEFWLLWKFRLYDWHVANFKVSLVSKDSSMLDGLDNASTEMEEAKVCLLLHLSYRCFCIWYCSYYYYICEKDGLYYVLILVMILFHFPPFNSFQARLNEIITSGAKTVQNNGSSEVPWMVDGAGLPSNASELLPKLVITLPKRSNA